MDWVLISSAAFADGISTKDSAQMTATNDAKVSAGKSTSDLVATFLLILKLRESLDAKQTKSAV